MSGAALILTTLFCLAAILLMWIVVSCLWHERAARISPSPVMPWVYNRAIGFAKTLTDPAAAHKIADLGSGWGGPLIGLSRAFPNAAVTGYELSPWPLLISRLRTLSLRDKIRIHRRDFFEEDLSGYSMIFCYLSVYHMERLKPQLARLRPGSIVISCSFEIKGWTAARQDILPGPLKIPVFLYRI